MVLEMDSSESPVHVGRRAALTTGTLSRFATTHSFYSTVTEIAWRRNCVRTTCTAQRTE